MWSKNIYLLFSILLNRKFIYLVQLFNAYFCGFKNIYFLFILLVGLLNTLVVDFQFFFIYSQSLSNPRQGLYNLDIFFFPRFLGFEHFFILLKAISNSKLISVFSVLVLELIIL